MHPCPYLPSNSCYRMEVWYHTLYYVTSWHRVTVSLLTTKQITLCIECVDSVA
jgi:hypothetical protein